MKVINTIASLRIAIQKQRLNNKTIALVPTMGNLHKGHLSLVDLALKHADIVVVSIFVNPMQFGENEDLDSYPRTLANDLKMLQELSVDIVFSPDNDEIYIANPLTTVSVANITQGLCGNSRPTHFDGVTTVVAKLFNICLPDIAVFGQKDFQQLLVIKKMVVDLNFDIKIISGPIIRESDGLAMSSRNNLLTTTDRTIAPRFNQLLNQARNDILNNHEISEVIAKTIKLLESQSMRVDYLEVRNADDLTMANTFTKNKIIIASVYLGKTKILDNLVV